MAEVTHTGTEPDTVDLLEHGRGEDGQKITSNRRLFMQLLVYGGCVDTTALVDALGRHGVSGALYEDVNDPHGVAVLTFSEDPVYFVEDVRRVLDPKLPWGVWYPLRRAGSFEQLPAKEQNTILMEHGGVGRAYGKAGYVHDVRLACHGLDKHDNDFVIGLLGPELHPLSSVVQRMRRTRQTSLHLERLGPFFVGRVAWQSAPPSP
jgi:hypothetical protein